MTKIPIFTFIIWQRKKDRENKFQDDHFYQIYIHHRLSFRVSSKIENLPAFVKLIEWDFQNSNETRSGQRGSFFDLSDFERELLSILFAKIYEYLYL